MSNSRVALVRLGCLVLAAYVSWPLFDMDPPRNPPDLLSTAVKHIRVHAPRPRPTVAETRETVIIKSEKPVTAPLLVKAQKAVPAPVKPIKEKLEAPVVDDMSPAPSVTQLEIPQPSLPPDSAAPPAPPDDLPSPQHFRDKPGGSVVILGVKLNSENVAIMTDILVASNTPLNDLTLAMTTRGVKWKEVKPPIPPGEYRWVEVRLDYAHGNDDSILP